MSATVRFVLGPPGADRLAPLLAAYREAAATGFGAAVFLVPTRRHAAQIRAALSTGLGPVVFDLQAFADELVRVHDPAARPHPEADRNVLVGEIAADWHDAGDVPALAGGGCAAAVGGCVAELKESGTDLRRLLKATPGREAGRAAHARHHHATRAFDRYQRQLAKLHRYDPADRLGRAAELWAAGKRNPFGRARSVFVAGFTSLAPFQRGLLDAVRATVDQFWMELPDGDGEAFAGPRAVRAWVSGPDTVTEYVEPSEAKPAGLREVARAFRATPASPGREPGEEPSAGLHLLEADDEARAVARRVRDLIADGTPADDILVVARRMTAETAEELREALDESGVPHDTEGAGVLSRVPAVGFLLRAWRLADEDWPLAGVAAVLGSPHFRPAWPEMHNDPETPARAEALLRSLGETRGRDAYLTAVRGAEHGTCGFLGDEDGDPDDAGRRELAAHCRPFLERFFRAWDRLRFGGSGENAVARLKAFADDIGLTRAAAADPDDEAGLARLWHELDRWARAEAAGHARKAVRAGQLGRVLAAITSAPGRGRSPRDGRRVRVLSADRAAGLDCAYLFLVGLGSGAWPDVSAPASLLDDPERERLRGAGVALPDPAARLAAERCLFLTLATAPRRGLFLCSRASESGEPQSPAVFLREFAARFTPPPHASVARPTGVTRDPTSGLWLRAK